MANPTTLQLGQYNYTTDTFGAHPAAEAGAVYDLNDGVTWSLLDSNSGIGDGLELGMPQATTYTVGNPRTTGRRRVRRVYEANRTIRARLILLPQTSYTNFINALQALLSLVEGITESQPAALKIQPPGSSTPVYADVISCSVAEKFAEMLYAQLVTDGIEIVFECLPHLHGPRQWLQNLCFNPGFEAPSAAGTIVFSDNLANNNAYVPLQYSATVQGDLPLRYYRMQELSGTTALDSGSAGQNGTYTGGVALGQAGICGGASFSALYNGTSGYISAPTTGLPTGNGAFTLECWINFASNPGATKFLWAMGTNSSAQSVVVTLGTTGKASVQFNGSSLVTSTAALTTSAWHQVAVTWDGTTLTLYVDGASTGTPITPGAQNLTYGSLLIGANFALNQFFPGNLEEAAVYTTALSSARILAHYNAGAPTALTTGTTGFADAVNTLNGASGTGGTLTVARYYRLDEPSGTTAFDASGNAQNGTYQASPTLGAASLLTGDTDASVSFASASSQYVNCPVSGLPTGNANISLFCRFNYPSHPGANQYLMTYGGGAGGAHNYIGIYIDSSGQLHADTGGTTVVSSALSTSANHSALVTWDGTTLRLYVDGATVGTPQTPGNQTLPTSSNFFRLAASANTAANLFYNGTLDEAVVFSGCLTATQASTLHTAATTSPSTAANTMQLPAAARVQFGSPNWGAIQNWQVRFQWVTGLNAVFYLHIVSTSNYLAASVTGTQIQILHVVGGVTHTLATVSSLGLVNGIWYWIKIVQFPALLSTVGNAPWVQASLYADSNGTVGTQVQTTCGPAQCFDNVTAMSGAPAIQANTSALTIGENFSGIQQVALWGPGTWQFTAENATTGQASGAWEANTANVYALGPFSSKLAARIDFPPYGTVNAFWNVYPGGSVANTGAMPTVSGNVIHASCYAKSTGLSASAQVILWLREFDTNGNFLRSTALQTITGNIGLTYTQLSGSVTTGASTVYCDVQLNALDTSVSGASASGAVWFDNVQCWDATATGMATMPYCELRYVQTPAQLQISGLLGQVPAPAILNIGLFLSSLPGGQTALMYLGRRAQGDNSGTIYTPGAQLIGYILNGTPTLDTTAYGGYRVAANPGVIANTIAQFGGIYELFARCQTANGSPTGVWLQPQINTTLNASANTATANDTQLAFTFGSQSYVFSAQNSWTIADLGQISLPPSVLPATADTTRISAEVSTWSGGSGGSQLTANYVAIIPKDGEMHVTNIVNPTGSLGITNQWLYTYYDGYAGVGALGQPSAGPLATPTLSASSYGSVSQLEGIVTGNSLPSANPLASVFPMVDPALLTLHSGGNGVNQYGVVAVNNNNAGLPSVALDVIYWPRYLSLT